MSSLAREEWYLQSLHQSEASDIFWVGIHGTCCGLSTTSKVTPLDRTMVHTCQWWDTDRCSEEQAFPWYQSDVYLSSEKLGSIHGHQPQIPRGDIICCCSSSDEIGQLICWCESASPSLLPLSQCQDQRWLSRLTWTNSAVYDKIIHRVLRKVTSWCSLDNYCCRRTLPVRDVGPILDHHSGRRCEACLQWFDSLARSDHQSEDDMLSFG
jgi:hypothetical protein